MTAQDTSPAAPPSDPNWSRRVIVFLVVLAILALIAISGAAFLPRWWAQRMGDQVDGSMTQGVLVGLFYGFVFTLLPLAALTLAFRFVRTWKPRVIVIVLGAFLAAPNLLTLGITLGDGSGAHAGDRILDVEAPGFRGATLAGALLAVAIMAFVWYLLASRRRAWRRVDELQAPTDEQTPADGA